jgi:hypothetical protein
MDAGAAVQSGGALAVQQVHTNRKSFKVAELSCMALLEQEIFGYRAKAGEFANKGNLEAEDMKIMKSIMVHVKELEAKLRAQQALCQTGEAGMKRYLAGVVEEYKALRRRKFESVIGSDAETQMGEFMAKAMEEVSFRRLLGLHHNFAKWELPLHRFSTHPCT